MLNRRITWQGTTYLESDIGEELYEAMLADNHVVTESSDIGDAAHARDRVYMRWTFFGKADAESYILQRLAELGF